MPQDPMSFEDVCRYAGRLFLTSQHEIDRLSAGHGNPVVQALREQLLAEQKKAVRLEEELADLRRQLSLREGAA